MLARLRLGSAGIGRDLKTCLLHPRALCSKGDKYWLWDSILRPARRPVLTPLSWKSIWIFARDCGKNRMTRQRVCDQIDWVWNQKGDRDLCESSGSVPKWVAYASLQRGMTFPSVCSVFDDAFEIAIRTRNMAPKRAHLEVFSSKSGGLWLSLGQIWSVAPTLAWSWKPWIRWIAHNKDGWIRPSIGAKLCRPRLFLDATRTL